MASAHVFSAAATTFEAQVAELAVAGQVLDGTLNSNNVTRNVNLDAGLMSVTFSNIPVSEAASNAGLTLTAGEWPDNSV